MFKNRQEAGQLLAQKLKGLKEKKVIVLGLTRGGVVVAWEVARALKAPWEPLVVKKIGALGNEELAIGAVGPDKVVVWDERLCQTSGVSEEHRKKLLNNKSREREEKEKFFRQGQKPVDLREKNVILVDDGIATGATTEAAITWIKSQSPQKVILAVPVAPPDAVEKLRPLVDDLICLQVEPDFWAVGQFYDEFPQVSDEEVKELLNREE